MFLNASTILPPHIALKFNWDAAKIKCTYSSDTKMQSQWKTIVWVYWEVTITECLKLIISIVASVIYSAYVFQQHTATAYCVEVQLRCSKNKKYLYPVCLYHFRPRKKRITFCVFCFFGYQKSLLFYIFFFIVLGWLYTL